VGLSEAWWWKHARAGKVEGRSPWLAFEAVAQLQQGSALAIEFARELGGRLLLSDTSENAQDLRGAAVRSLQGGPRPGVEDAAAMRTAVIQDRLTPAAVNVQAALSQATRTP
jgi:hypothetical protein